MRPTFLVISALSMTGACVGSGPQVSPRHPAHASAASTPLPSVADALVREDTVEPAPSEHAHAHHHHHGHTPSEASGD
jgi:hypothetical protein